jgi:predicted PurR-regulated permease PerM
MFGRMRESRRSRADEAADRAVARAERRRVDTDEVDDAEAAAAREERLSERFAAQWHEMRVSRRPEEPVIEGGASNFSRAQVPWAFDLAAAWSWRILVVAAAVFGTLWLLSFFAVVVLPLLVAMFASALLTPVVHLLMRIGAGRRIASLVVVIFSIAAVGLLLTFVGQQIASGMDDLTQQVGDGLQQVRDWLRTGPLELSDKDLQNTLKDLQDQLGASDGSVISRVTEVGTTVTHIVAGFFIVLFGTYFFLADGPLIWTWFVRLFPRAARLRVDSSGRVGWRSLTQFVRATVLVAGTDAIGVMIIAAILGVPLVFALGVLVFIGAFVPMIGAFVSGTVAVLVALVAQGPVTAVLMLAGVVVVQQIEAHILPSA